MPTPVTVIAPVTVPASRQRTSAKPATLTRNRPGTVVLSTAEPPPTGVTASPYQAAPSIDASKYTVPDEPAAGDGLAEGLRDADGLAEPDGLMLAEPEGEAEPDGLRDALDDAEGDLDAEALADVEADGLALDDGDLDAEADALDDGLGETDPDGLMDVDALGDLEADADADVEPDGEAEPEGLSDGETLGETDGLTEAEELADASAAIATWIPRRDRPMTSAEMPLPVDSAAAWNVNFCVNFLLMALSFGQDRLGAAP